MPIITNPSILPNGTVGIPYSVTLNIDKQGDPSYPYVLQLQTALTLPPGLENNFRAAKVVDQDGSGIGSPISGETIIGQTSLAQGTYIRLAPGINIGMEYIPTNNNSFSLGENVDGEVSGGTLGAIDSAITPSPIYGARLCFPPTFIPLAIFDDINWTISGIPTTAGVYNFQVRMYNGNEQLYTGFNFQITIDDAPIPQPTQNIKKRFAPMNICFERKKTLPCLEIIKRYGSFYKLVSFDNLKCCYKKI